MDCPECGEELHTIKGLCTDRDAMREDKYCAECNIRYGLRSSGLTVLASLKLTKLMEMKKKVKSF